MEREINNFLLICFSILTSLCYCYTIGQKIPQGTIRLLAISPVIGLFLILPLYLSSIHLGFATSSSIAWLANSKLLLFAYGQPPLSSNPPMPLPRFILLASLPINIQLHPSPPISEKPLNTQNQENPSPKIAKKGHKSPLSYAIKGLLLGLLVRVYDYREHFHAKVILLFYCFHIYLCAELVLSTVADLARAFFGLEVEPPFDEPYLSTSLQDFWGRRWNLVVSSILRPTVYDPVQTVSSRLIGRKWAPIVGILATFLVSAVMHELIFFYLGRVKPTWEVTCFFLLQGVCLAVETALKKALNGKLRLPPVVSRPLAVGFVVFTSFWLLFPPILRTNLDVRVSRESIACIEFVKDIRKRLF